jgi:nitrogen regulatory protein P-II 1
MAFDRYPDPPPERRCASSGAPRKQLQGAWRAEGPKHNDSEGGCRMKIKLITAIFPRERLEAVERGLRQLGVERVDVSKVKGYGEYRNLYTQDWMVEEIKLDIFTRADEVEGITKAIIDTAHTGVPGDGIVAVVPVESLFLIRTRAEATPEEFWPKPDDHPASDDRQRARPQPS